MGLDMYLYLEKDEFLSRWDETYEDHKDTFYPAVLQDFAKDIQVHNFMQKTTKYQVGYWRKENAIHNWFVQHCTDGVDNCREVYVSTEDIEDLLSTCETVLNDPSCAQAVLPTKSGFFFGSYDYDEWYFRGVEYTRDLCRKILDFKTKEEKLGSYWEIKYRASW